VPHELALPKEKVLFDGKQMRLEAIALEEDVH